NLHEVFDELCRVTKQYLIISLPNPWASFMAMWRYGYYERTELPMKFYNLPVTPPADRHKWFYGLPEAERFLRVRARMNGLEVLQMDREATKPTLKRRFYRIVLKVAVHRDIDVDSFFGARVWAVLVK
ncbi:MAG: hypothetical protein JSW30_01215, partial [Dehalococcoidia bacterium]